MRVELGEAIPDLQSLRAHDGVVEMQIYGHVGGKSSHILTACVLNGCLWPLFKENPLQNCIPSPDIFFRREGPEDRRRLAQTLNGLTGRQAVAWVGTRGVAKPAGLNELALELLGHLGEPDYPNAVGLRTDDNFIDNSLPSR